MSRTWRRTWCRAGALERVGVAAPLARSGRLCPADGVGTEEGPLRTPRGALRGPSQHLPLGSGSAASSASARLIKGGSRLGECRTEPEVGAGEAEPRQRPPQGSRAARRP